MVKTRRFDSSGRVLENEFGCLRHFRVFHAQSGDLIDTQKPDWFLVLVTLEQDIDRL